MRRLPVLQPLSLAILERRSFLLGLVAVGVGGAAACSSEPEPAGPSRSTSSSSSSSSGGASGGAVPDGGGDEDDDDAGQTSSSGNLPTKDAGTADASDGSTGGSCATTGYDAGPPGSFAMGTVKYIASALAFVGRDSGGLYAMYALCTHAVGNMTIGGNVLTCTVHGAQFSFTGAVTRGPATMALPHFAICLDAKGNLRIDTNTIVPATSRLVA